MSESKATNNIPSEDEEDAPSEDKEEEDETDHWPIPVTDNTKSHTLPISITKLNDEELSALIKFHATARYGDEAKEIQVSAVVNLKAIVLSLNPLDTLRDNQ
ncbi:hypothetical protein PCASD_16390 [Puccinia coronata f. sp. avenae]|uniref:Uncharacterized protein n=1 Tax=Puccinia coronata f. sp. avenae TaxID=200324 RepID=A0A2N5SUF3_9BASI|nr:hypothetical protein PCASD_16390 [Puccinia coronata f. sp. avenae]